MAGRLYDRRVWKRLRAQHLREHPLCEDCALVGVTRTATDVDHRKALRDGGEPLDPANLRSLCHSCHSRKTRHVEQLGQQRVPVKGCDANGRPLDAAHWWNG